MQEEENNLEDAFDKSFSGEEKEIDEDNEEEAWGDEEKDDIPEKPFNNEED